MTSLRVLITNNTLAARAGTELYVRDIAAALLRKGHRPVAFSMTLGEVAEELRSLTVPVIDDLGSLGVPPDVIHGHHHYETMMALLQFPDAPAISFCHGWLPWQEAPPRFPRILRYVAPDETCRDRLIFENGIAPHRISLLFNFVDLDRFQRRGPLPSSPRKALVFSNALNVGNGAQVLRETCEGLGIPVDVVGLTSGRVAARPEDLLGGYDIVFAKAKSALEALAVGAAVVACDTAGIAGMVTTENVEAWRRLNFGIRTLSQPISAEVVRREVMRYDAADAGRVSHHVRQVASLDHAVEELIGLYGEVVGELDVCDRNRATELLAASAYLRQWAPRFKGLAQQFDEAQRLWRETQAIRGGEEGRLGYQLLQRMRRILGRLFPLGTARGKAYLGLLGFLSRIVGLRETVRTS